MIKEFAFINFFRAIAAFWVLAVHCMIWGGWYGIPLPPGKMAVDTFMIISGFLMASNSFSRHDIEPLNSAKNWFRFWLRRFFRIAPAYYLSLALVVIFSEYFLGGYQELQAIKGATLHPDSVYNPARIVYSPFNILLHLSFLFGLHPMYSFSTFLPDWSLSLEMQFYFVFPALIILMYKFGFIRVALLIGIPAFMLGIYINQQMNYFEPSLLFMKLNYFIAGILIFCALHQNISKQKTIGLVLCALFFVSIEFKYGLKLIILPLLLIAMLTFGWLEVNLQTPKWLSILVNNRVIRFASDCSYAVYLFHGIFISAAGLIISRCEVLLILEPPQRVLFIFLFVTTFSYLFAYLVFRFIELPGIQIGRSILKKVKPTKTKHSFNTAVNKAP